MVWKRVFSVLIWARGTLWALGSVRKREAGSQITGHRIILLLNRSHRLPCWAGWTLELKGFASCSLRSGVCASGLCRSLSWVARFVWSDSERTGHHWGLRLFETVVFTSVWFECQSPLWHPSVILVDPSQGFWTFRQAIEGPIFHTRRIVPTSIDC